MDIPDLSKLGQKKEEENKDPMQVRTAFLVVIDENGEVFVTPDINMPVNRASLPNADEIYSACSIVQRDITVQIQTQNTLVGMQQVALAQAKQMQDQQLANRLHLKK